MASSSPEVYVEEHNVIIAPSGIETRAWPVYWSAIWTGALSALAVDSSSGSLVRPSEPIRSARRSSTSTI